jgi:hypothetical protein
MHMRFIAFSTVHGLSIGYGETAREARDSALSELQIRSARYIQVIDCGEAGGMIWAEMTPLELVREHRPVVRVDDVTGTARKLTLAALALLMLSGCAEYNRAVACRTEAGPQPMDGAGGFGPIGVMIRDADPEHQAWDARRRACMARTAPKPVAAAVP